MKNEVLQTLSPALRMLPPVLRGITFDGRKGAFVRFRPGLFPAGKGVFNFAGRPDDPEELVRAVGKFEKENAGLPGAVSLAGAGTFFLGRSFQEAEPREEVLEFLAPGNPCLGRGDVVRDKVAVVTGGAQGFGAGIARRLAEEGAFVFIADMNAAGAAELAEKLNAEAGRLCARPAEVNVTDGTSVEAMMETVLREAGGADLFVSNAGVLRAGSVKDQAQGEFEFVTAVNYTGYFLCAQAAARVMALQNKAAELWRGGLSGSQTGGLAGAPAGEGYFTDIIQINSKSGLAGSNRNGAYAGGKFGGIGLTQSFAMELVADNIKVNSICPGNFFEGPLWMDPEKGLFVQYMKSGKVPGAKTTEDVKRHYESRVPMGRGCREEDVVRAILYVVEQKYETGQAVPVTGGQIMLN